MSVPGKEWCFYKSPEEGHYNSNVFKQITDKLEVMPTTSMMVVVDGKVIYSYGDISQVSYLASARKSILSLLYGRYVKSGKINLDSTLDELGIDDIESLLPIEKTARVRDLLMSSSGVYHPQGSPGGELMVPERGSKEPGKFFLYNNWDFNVAGAILEKATRQSIFDTLGNDLAIPLQFQDYDPKRQRMLGFESVSRYKAYHMFLSARDMARLGVLVLNRGRWNEQEIVPKEWIDESLKVHVHRSNGNGPNNSYGYFWWLPEEKSPEWKGAFLASGNYGQFILGLPALNMVIVHRRAVSDEFAINRNLGIDSSTPEGVSVEQLFEITDLIIAARLNTGVMGE
ncbi:beta-lactamase family protein [Paenibacillus doosanensis]|uniref:serine hydrolase domain-containing protein n=1 Tax=Paenibacillus doosanensis TaxID=1229154 RepID=UPI0021801335|nr:serine hydrolase [Paenibacillus doosanensis]MCS7461448.1 beta-lactamase family protein [Paenibacillus doosanensis]